jgi:hypothetical protein
MFGQPVLFEFDERLKDFSAKGDDLVIHIVIDII